jgi:hypothetical protein
MHNEETSMNTHPLHHDEPFGTEGGHEPETQSDNASESDDDHHDHDDASPDEDDEDHHLDDVHAAAVEQPYDEQALATIVAAANWDNLTKRLLAYASYRLNRFSSAKRSGYSADDFVQQAVTLLLTGQRRFPLNGEIQLFGFLCGVIDSLTSHAAEKVRRRTKNGSSEVSIVSDRVGDAAPDEVTEEHLGAPADFEAELIARDRFERFVGSLEPRLAAYVRLRSTGRYATAEEYAKALSTAVPEIRNLDRQLWRRRKRYDMCEPKQIVRSNVPSQYFQLPMGA